MSKRAQLPRPRRSGLASLVALLVLVGCVLVAIAAVQIAQDRDRTVLGSVSWVAERLRTRDWSDVGVLIAGVGLGVVGVLLLVAGLVPARRPFVRLVDPDPHTIAGVTRGGLARELGALASAVDGVASAKATVKRRRVRVDAQCALRDDTGVQEAIETAVRDRLAALQPQRPLTVTARLRKAGE